MCAAQRWRRGAEGAGCGTRQGVEGGGTRACLSKVEDLAWPRAFSGKVQRGRSGVQGGVTGGKEESKLY